MMVIKVLMSFVLVTSLGTVTSQDVCDNRAILSRLNALERELETVREKQTIMEEMMTDEVNSLFFATFTDYQNPVTEGSVIRWNHAPINNGDGYNTDTGEYTAPYHGYYQFTVTQEGSEYFSGFLIFIDDVETFHNQISTPGDSPSSTTSIIVELTAGQTVKVKPLITTVIYGKYDGGKLASWFTGFLLYEVK